MTSSSLTARPVDSRSNTTHKTGGCAFFEAEERGDEEKEQEGDEGEEEVANEVVAGKVVDMILRRKIKDLLWHKPTNLGLIDRKSVV